MNGPKVAELFATAQALRAAGQDALADFYAENCRRVQNGLTPIPFPPPHQRCSTHLAEKAAAAAPPAPFVGDAREL